jgi:ATP-dependent exoDNAse (exonuclease V) beta subunit
MVMRSFARDLGRYPAYDVEVGDDQVFADAVDRMYSELADKKDLLSWMEQLYLEAMENDGKWDISSDIASFVKDFSREDYRIMARGFEPEDIMGTIGKIKASVSGRERMFAKNVKAMASGMISQIEGNGLSVNDFKGGKRGKMRRLLAFSGSMYRISPDDLVKYVSDMESLAGEDDLASKKADAAKMSAVAETLRKSLSDFASYLRSGLKEYLSCVAVDKRLGYLAMVSEIRDKVLEYCRENDVVLLSDTTELLNRIIDGSDTPFVYEKIGNRFDSFLLDEFQDTSKLQWDNFRPLLANSISEGNDDLVVGDVKQSIYRWRNSDWTILQSGLEEDFPGRLDVRTLQGNWRSGRNIVDFNNGFFTAMTGFASSQLESIISGDNHVGEVYADLKQKAMRNSEGCVRVNFIEEDMVNTCRVRSMQILLEDISETEKYYSPGDMTVLTRTNSEGHEIAGFLVDNGYSVVTSDSLFIGSSDSVREIVKCMRFMDSPDSPLAAAWRITGGENAGSDIASDLYDYPLYEMTEEITRTVLAPKEKKDIAYIQAFLDLVLDFSSKHGSDLSGFLKWWDEQGIKKTISAPQGSDAITVMTVHKSKGLSAKVVFIPFFNIRLDDMRNGTIWCRMPESVARYAGPVPVKSSGWLSETFFRDDYFNELRNTYIDNMNIAYVAFTRASEMMVINSFNPVKNSFNGGIRLPSLLYEFCSGAGEIRERKSDKDNRGLQPDGDSASLGKCEVYEAGWPGNVAGGGRDSAVSDSAPLKIDSVPDYSINEIKGRIAASLQTGSLESGVSVLEKGILLHYIFSLINVESDIESAVRSAIDEGVVTIPDSEDEDSFAGGLGDMIRSMISSDEIISGWFSYGNRVMNEKSILSSDGSIYRPDRVVIIKNPDGTAITEKSECEVVIVDYKFGKFKGGNSKYVNQVRNYKSLLQDMGYGNVSGYLWYPLEKSPGPAAGIVEKVC